MYLLGKVLFAFAAILPSEFEKPRLQPFSNFSKTA